MEVSFAREIRELSHGEGEVFRGEAILAVSKALLQSGVSYVGGYQGAPVSHLLDVMVQARELMEILGVHVETSTSEAGAAAMLAASIGYPIRGAVTWKSVVGTNVASDALSNLASAGVVGGVLIIVGEDFGEGASVIQERTHAFALKSSIWLLDPRPDLPFLVDIVGRAFELSEASNTPVMLQLRIRACHRYGEFVARDNVRPAISTRDRLDGPHAFDYARLSHPPATFVQEADKIERRLPAARLFIVEHGLNETVPGELQDLGLILQGGHYNTVIGRLARLGLAGTSGASRIPMLVLNVTHPLVPEQLVDFCRGKRSVLVIEEGAPEYIEQLVRAELARAELSVRVHGKDILPAAGEYSPEVLERGLRQYLRDMLPDTNALQLRESVVREAKRVAAELLSGLPERPPTFCTGCPERPMFTALKLLKREIGPIHTSADIGCHALATFPPFNSGHTILGYGMSLAASAAVARTQARRPISIMGDGGFWHNGLITGVAGAAFNDADSVLVVLDNGYSSATGAQAIPSTVDQRRAQPPTIENAVRAVGVKWVRTVRTYDLRSVLATLRDAMTTAERGLKVIVARGECMLQVQRRARAANSERLKRGERVVRVRFGVDEDTCTGDHSCIRLSGCPSLTIKPNPDPLRRDPVAHVNNGCVGCGLCGEVAHAARLCPSFYEARIVQNPTRWDRLLARVRATVIGWLAPRSDRAGAAS